MKQKHFSLCWLVALLLVTTRLALSAVQTNVPGPAGSGSFGATVTVLPNGNFVVTDPSYDASGSLTDAGRVYLYNGKTLALINTLTGNATNDLVGSNTSAKPVAILANGDYVVCSSSWSGGRGAATRCSATTGCPATITSSNSLVGTSTGDNVGSEGVVALPNGNYVVRSSYWDNGAATDAGALTWCDGTAGCTGNISASNSRVGSSAGDQIGLIKVLVLSNNNYVSDDVMWSNGAAAFAGAVTFCTGTAPCTGAVSVANSLVGTTTNEFTGNNGVFALSNGNYVVNNGGWKNGAVTNAGAATFCNGTTGCHAAVSTANSLTGAAAGDQVGLSGIAALSNGNYVVRSPNWRNGGAQSAGAATFCSGTIGCAGITPSASNSLVGSTAADGVGAVVTGLTNGNYVVNSPSWDNVAAAKTDVGASTFCNGTSGCTGLVTAANSLTGPSAGDRVGGNTVALTNGSYVVVSQQWNNMSTFATGTGAVTLCGGTSGCQGFVTQGNSLVGSSNNDNVGNVTALTNGNYVVTDGSWSNGGQNSVGSATFCSGTTGCTGAVAPSNSLIGTTINNQVGGFNPALALTNGNYVVISPNWDNGNLTDVGALTLCSGVSGLIGTVSPSNSLVGSTPNDMLGATVNGETTALPNGDYVLHTSTWDNGAIVDAGAIVIGYRDGSSVGPITSSNSVRGQVANAGSTLNFSYDATNNQLVVGKPAENLVTIVGQTVPGVSFPVKITSITRLSNGHIFIQGTGTPNTTYTVERSLSLAPSNFVPIGTVLASASGLIQYDDATAFSLTEAFYRLASP